jgi:DNA primase large subunit
MEPAGFTKNDLAKYPFLKETAKYLSPLDLQVEDLTAPGMGIVLRRAEERVTLAITDLMVRPMTDETGNKYVIKDLQKEIISFPVAILLVSATDNSLIKKRYALAEAKQATSELNMESKEKILKIALDFNWKMSLTTEESGSSFDFVLHFADFLRNASHMHNAKWKLINSILSEGSVYLKTPDVVRLLQEEIRRRIEKRLDSAKLDRYPHEIELIADKLKTLASEQLAQSEAEFPKVIVQEAFPPCINALYDAASKNHHLSHMGRFTLTSFLVNIGMSSEAVAELFRTFSDFNERLTRYQVEHIAGERGSGTKYTCPQCSILQTHNVCKNRDDLCRRIYHPLKYYQLKVASAPAKDVAAKK